MGKLFEAVPENFFHPLAAPGKVVYWECIERLFAITSKQLSFGIEREVLVDDLTYYFDSPMAAEPALDEDVDTTGMSARDKANLILRRLESYGWIYIDVDHSYVQRVNFRDYAVTMIKTLQSIAGGKKTEYQGYIYTIYNLVRAKANPGVGLLQIVDNTDALITGLKTLNANIKKYIDDLTKHQTIQEIMDALLNDYYTNVIDKAYHRLVTSDNVSKFRPEILDRLEADARSRRFLDQAASEIAEIREISVEEARNLALDYLHQVMTAFRDMDTILEEINQKNTKYQGAAIARAKFLLTSSEDLRGQLKNIVTRLGERMREEELDPAGMYELEETDRLIRLFSWKFLDMDSLYAPIEGKKEFVPQDIEIAEVDEAERIAKRLRMKQKLENVLSPGKIENYVSLCLGERREMHASEILMMAGPEEEEAKADRLDPGALHEETEALHEETGIRQRGSENSGAEVSVNLQGREDTNSDMPVKQSDEKRSNSESAARSAYSDMERFIRIIYIRLYGQRKRMLYRVIPQETVSMKGYRFKDFLIVRRDQR